jgi:HAD superfamily hydrolase (TIGR01509 family)
MTTRGIIFDCDGVLFESRQANLAYYNKVLAHFGEAPVLAEDNELAHLCHTAASPQVLLQLLGPDRHSQALAYAATFNYRGFIPYMIPEPGLHQALDRLASRLPLAIATNRGTSMVEILEHFGLTHFFQAVVTSRDVHRPKPHPDMLLLAAERLGLATDELLFVGDSELDRLAAAAAGIRFVAYQGGVPGDVQIDGHAELVEMLFPSGF